MNDWKVEKRLDLSMILSAVIVVAGIFVWASDLNRTLAETNQKVIAIEKDIHETRTYLYKLEERMENRQ